MTQTLELQPTGCLLEAPLDPFAIRTRQVLLVEDDLDIQEGLATYLRWQGFQVLTAADGARALRIIESENVDALILDLGLPGIHGLDVLHEMRMRQRSLPTLVVTATSSIQTDLEARAVGADEVLSKPVRPSDVLRAVEDLLG